MPLFLNVPSTLQLCRNVKLRTIRKLHSTLLAFAIISDASDESVNTGDDYAERAARSDASSAADLIFLGEQFFYVAFKVFSCVHSSENSFFIDEPEGRNGTDVVLDCIF
jgi:hypothetical protein